MGVVKSAAAVVRVPGEYLALAQTRQKASWHQLSRQAVSSALVSPRLIAGR